MSLSEKRENILEGLKDTKHFKLAEWVLNIVRQQDEEAIKELKIKGLKKTLYPKYLMLTSEDLKQIFGEELLEDSE